jgi:hypothetical protein
MRHLSLSSAFVYLRSVFQIQTTVDPAFGGRLAYLRLVSGRTALGFLGGIALSLVPTLAGPAAAQNQAAPTVRYARGENVSLDEIIAEWRGYYADVPVYLCTCQEDTCNQTQQWPYREYDRYQFGVALGPANGKVAENSGSNCFDIADGSRPDNPRSFSSAQTGAGSPPAAAAPPDNNTRDNPPVAPPGRPNTPPSPDLPQPAEPNQEVPTAVLTPVPKQEVPTATSINNGAAIRLEWPSGASDDIAVTSSNWNVTVLDALDCEQGSLVEQKTMTAQRVVGAPAVSGVTGNVAVPVLLDSCVETDQSAVFVLDPTEGGGYALYRTQLPGDRDFPNEFSTYALSSLDGLLYWDGSLLVRHGSASGAQALVIFRPDSTSGSTPAGVYAGCGITRINEGSDRLCPDR